MNKFYCGVFSFLLIIVLTTNVFSRNNSFNFNKNDDDKVSLYGNSDPTSWLPLEVGNRWQYLKKIFEYWDSSPMTAYSFSTIQIMDTTYIENKKYYLISGFLSFPENTLIRYDSAASQILIYSNGAENIFMDFSLPDSSTFFQIQPDNNFLNVTVISKSQTLFDTTLFLKGFYVELSYQGVIYKKGWYYFSPSIGYIYQDEWTNKSWVLVIDFTLLEYLQLNNLGQSLHRKHNYQPQIQFEPILFIPTSNPKIEEDFVIDHEYSFLSSYPYITGCTYINKAQMESFYLNANDTILNPNHHIVPLTEIDFSLDAPVDTNLYNQDYHLFYRIAAVDKGIIPDTFYLPETGYYKLYWRDSTSTVVNDENKIFKFEFSQNYPNPFNPNTTIKYTIPSAGLITIKVFDVLGKEVATLVNAEKPARNYEIEFNAANLTSGIYFYQLKAGSFVETKKMILLR